MNDLQLKAKKTFLRCRRVLRMKPRITTILYLMLSIIFLGTIAFSFMGKIPDAKAATAQSIYSDTQESDETVSSDESEAMSSNDHEAVSSDEDETFLKVPVGHILLQAPGDIKPKRSPVDLPHSRHFTYNCQICHHTWEGDENLQTCTASGCHDQVNRPKSIDGRPPDPKQEIAYFKTAFHQLCITCHKDIQQQNLDLELSLKQIKGKLPKTGPTSCNQCHPPENV